MTVFKHTVTCLNNECEHEFEVEFIADDGKEVNRKSESRVGGGGGGISSSCIVIINFQEIFYIV